MSISGISSNIVSSFEQHQTNSVGKQRMQDLKQISTSLSNGDVSGAQQAFQSLQSLSAGKGSGNSTIENDFQSLGSALQSGSLSSSQSAFSQLQQALKSVFQSSGFNATSVTDNATSNSLNLLG